MNNTKQLAKALIKKFSRYSIFENKKNTQLALILGSVIVLPALLVVLFFYGDINTRDLASSLSLESENELNSEENTEQPTFELKLISREDFLEDFNPEPAFLPRPVEITASLSGFLRSNSSGALLPARNWGVSFEDIEAETALALEVPSKRILYGKNVFESRPIASLSKLVVALVAIENMDINEEITVSNEAIRTEGNAGDLVTDEKFTLEKLLYALLLESSNDAAAAIEEHYNKNRDPGTPDFVSMMNKKVISMGLNDTVFEEPTGLSENNKSSAISVAEMLYATFENQTLRDIISTPTYTTTSLNRGINHYWINLNALLGVEEDVLGGKTGYTEEAGPSMATIAKTPQDNKYLVVVVLNADDRLEASRSLLNWTKKAYIWTE
ncbi:MAG: serine hydrolase [Candidatus Spechtbacterales bacterium]|nr:serine hydrolase [Candidatus Spechtbacterales bacterium]